MRKSFWEKKIPTLVAFVVILASIWVTSYLVRSGIITIGKAASELVPQNIQVTDITDTSFVVAFTTQQKTNVAVRYGQTEEGESMAYDERAKSSQESGIYYSHRIPINNLNPNTKYVFSIISGGSTFLQNGETFSVTTSSSIPPLQTSYHPVYGKAMLSNGLSAQDTLVYLKIDDAIPVSVLTNNAGEFLIPLDFVRKQDLKSYYEFSDSSIINVQVMYQDMLTDIKTTYKNAESIPAVTLPNNYDFRTDVLAVLTPTPTLSQKLTVPLPSGKSGEVKIEFPQAQQSLVDSKPIFRGTAQPGAKVKITINSSHAVQTEVTADSNGLWTFRPDTPLAAGEHTVTIETTDAFGIVRKLSQKFSVFAQGSQVTQTATPSATPRFSPTPTRRVSPTPTTKLTPTFTPAPTVRITGTVTPPVGGLPTSTPTRIPTLSPTTSSLLSPTPTGGIATATPTLTTTPAKIAGLTPTLQVTGTPFQVGDSTAMTFFASFSLLLIVVGVIFLFVI